MLNAIRLTKALFAVLSICSLLRAADATSAPMQFNAAAGRLQGAAVFVPDKESASGTCISGLDTLNSAVSFAKMPRSSKLAVRYSSLNYGTFSVYVNNVFALKINLHSTGAKTGSYIYAVVDIPIPKNATVTLKHDEGDAAWSISSILVGNDDLGLKPDIWNLPPLPIAAGKFQPSWQDLSTKYESPEWYRDAKFGAWSHWDPQAVPEMGDWYARDMYIEGTRDYNYQIANYGYPSIFGYKDLCHIWNPTAWDPDAMMKLYIAMGARFFVAMGGHHDNFDCFDSKYQPWNSVNVGPKEDIVGIWAKTARKYNMRFGFGYHATPSRTWSEFLPVRYGSDKKGPYAGVPYDGMLTIADGKGKWWEGMDPVDLNGPPHGPLEPSLSSPFANQFMWRLDDAITKYHPDLVYLDDSAGDSIRELGGVIRGLGFLAPQIAANYYNKSLVWNGGKTDVVLAMKDVGGRYNSFSDQPDQLPLAKRSFVRSSEGLDEPSISDYPFGCETSIGEWHYNIGQAYKNSNDIIWMLMDTVSRNGTLMLNLTQHGDGHLDDQVIKTMHVVGAWLQTNGEAVYFSRPFDVYGEGPVRYTRANGNVYVTVRQWPGPNTLDLQALKTGGPTIGNVTGVTLLGSEAPVPFKQDALGLHVDCSSARPVNEINVFKIETDKVWVNDDDPETYYSGWEHAANLGDGSYNNDCHFSTHMGDSCRYEFNGTGIDVIGATGPQLGALDVYIDGVLRKDADLTTTSPRQVQQTIFSIRTLSKTKHEIKLINVTGQRVEIDAFVVHQ
jgi:alpha-L-fucosidase